MQMIFFENNYMITA